MTSWFDDEMDRNDRLWDRMSPEERQAVNAGREVAAPVTAHIILDDVESALVDRLEMSKDSDKCAAARVIRRLAISLRNALKP